MKVHLSFKNTSAYFSKVSYATTKFYIIFLLTHIKYESLVI